MQPTDHPAETPRRRRKNQRYSDEERAAALEMYAELGSLETARRTGISANAIRGWARRAGITSQVQHANAKATAAAIQRRRRTAEERKAVLVEKLGELAELGVDTTLYLVDKRKGIDDLVLRDVIGAWTRAIHDLQLLSGGATERTEKRDLASADEVLRLRDDLAERRARKAAGQ